MENDGRVKLIDYRVGKHSKLRKENRTNYFTKGAKLSVSNLTFCKEKHIIFFTKKGGVVV